MQLWHVGYGHASTRHNPAEPEVSLWTPGGEHPVGSPAAGRPPRIRPQTCPPRSRPSSQAMQAEMEQVRQQLLAAPAVGGHRQPRHGHLRAGRHPPHRRAAEAGRGRRSPSTRWPPSSRACEGRLGRGRADAAGGPGPAPGRLPGGPDPPDGDTDPSRRSIPVTHGEVTAVTSGDQGMAQAAEPALPGGQRGGRRTRSTCAPCWPTRPTWPRSSSPTASSAT